MRCSNVVKYLSTYLDLELGAKEVALLEAHLAQCDRCRAELEQLQLVQGLFKDARKFSAPPAFRAKVLGRLQSQPAQGFSFFPMFIRFAEIGVFLLAITAGIMSGGMLISAVAPHYKGEQVIAALSLETFEALPPDSLGGAYLAMTEGRQ